MNMCIGIGHIYIYIILYYYDSYIHPFLTPHSSSESPMSRPPPPLRCDASDGMTGICPGRSGGDQAGVHGGCSQSCRAMLQGGRGSTQRGRSQGGIVVSHSGSCSVGLVVGLMVGLRLRQGGLGAGGHVLQVLGQFSFMKGALRLHSPEEAKAAHL